jgi:hypothetical protein
MLSQRYTQENSGFLQSSVWLSMSCANKLNPVTLYCPTHSKHILCAFCGMLAELTGTCVSTSYCQGRRVTNESGKTVIMWQRELFIWFPTVAVVLKWRCCYVNSGSYSYSHFFRITCPQMSHFSQQQWRPLPPFIFVGVYYFIFLLYQLLPQSQIASVIRSSRGTVEFYSSHVSLIIQFLLKVIQVCQDYNLLPTFTLLQASFNFISQECTFLLSTE